MKAAAAIISEDIHSMAFDTNAYATSEATLNDMSVIPETLQIFTNNVINKRKKDNAANETRKSTDINHAIIAATRTRAFLSMIHVVLPVYIHMDLAFRRLIHLLSSMGVCASCSEARQYEVSAIIGDPQTFSTV